MASISRLVAIGLRMKISETFMPLRSLTVPQGGASAQLWPPLIARYSERLRYRLLSPQSSPSLDEAGPETEIDFASEYQLLVYERLVVKVGDQELTLGTVAKSLLSARYSLDDDQLVARPFRNDTMHKYFSPDPEAAGPYERRVLGKPIGLVDDPAD